MRKRCSGLLWPREALECGALSPLFRLPSYIESKRKTFKRKAATRRRTPKLRVNLNRNELEKKQKNSKLWKFRFYRLQPAFSLQLRKLENAKSSDTKEGLKKSGIRTRERDPEK
jgi:hypothetical protein